MLYKHDILSLCLKKPCRSRSTRRIVVWLKGQGYGQGNFSAAVDDLITAARAGRLGAPAPVRSVVGTIDLAADDPRLERADRAMRDLFAASLARPLGCLRRARPRTGSARQTLTPPWLIFPAAVSDTHALLFHAAARRALGRGAAALSTPASAAGDPLRAGGRDLGISLLARPAASTCGVRFGRSSTISSATQPIIRST